MGSRFSWRIGPSIPDCSKCSKRRSSRGLNVAHHPPLGQVPEHDRFDRLSSGSKDVVDTIKLVAYRAETAMAQVVRGMFVEPAHAPLQAPSGAWL